MIKYSPLKAFKVSLYINTLSPPEDLNGPVYLDLGRYMLALT